MMIEWISVHSSAIRKIGYEVSSHRMFIDFEDSDPYYTFCGVPNKGVRSRIVTSEIQGAEALIYTDGGIKDSCPMNLKITQSFFRGYEQNTV